MPSLIELIIAGFVFIGAISTALSMFFIYQVNKYNFGDVPIGVFVNGAYESAKRYKTKKENRIGRTQ